MNDRRNSRRLSSCVLALAIAAIGAPMAQARHVFENSVPDASRAAQINAATRHHHPDLFQRPTRIVAVSRANAFDWGDAGIGAAGALGAALLAGGTTLFVKRHKNERTMTARLEA
jgi:hypothetical protein